MHFGGREINSSTLVVTLLLSYWTSCQIGYYYMSMAHRVDVWAEDKHLRGNSVWMVEAWDWMRSSMKRKNLENTCGEKALRCSKI